jgi:hypothetical protein
MSLHLSSEASQFAAPLAGGQSTNLFRVLDPAANFDFGPFRVGPLLGTTLADPDTPAVFDMVWRGRPVQARLADESLHVRVILGRVPSTATGGAPLRNSVFDTLQHLPAQLPPAWQMGLLPDHRVVLEWVQNLPPPINVPAIVCSLTEFLLALAPYLDLLEEAGVTLLPASIGSDGTSSACPG